MSSFSYFLQRTSQRHWVSNLTWKRFKSRKEAIVMIRSMTLVFGGLETTQGLLDTLQLNQTPFMNIQSYILNISPSIPPVLYSWGKGILHAYKILQINTIFICILFYFLLFHAITFLKSSHVATSISFLRQPTTASYAYPTFYFSFISEHWDYFQLFPLIKILGGHPHTRRPVHACEISKSL